MFGIIMRRGSKGLLGGIAVAAAILLLTACGSTSRPISVESVAGSYMLYQDAIREANSLLEGFGDSALPEVSLDLDSDGSGSLRMEADGTSEEKALSWRLDGGSRNPEILLTLTDPISPKDKWVSFLMMLESDPTHTKIRGSVSEGEIRLRQSVDDGEGEGAVFVFTKVLDA